MNTQEFLTHFPGTIFQTFDDKGKDLSLTKSSKSLTLDQLKELNDKGAGVFFTPHAFPVVRKQADCTKLNCWFMEMDTGTIEEQLAKLDSAPIYPTIVVKTRKSLHCYWLPPTEHTIPFESYKTIISGLIYHFDADPACKDYSRVMRIPGFFHHKQEPLMVEVVSEDLKDRYTAEEMLQAYPAPPDLDLFHLSTVIPSKAVLEAISGDKLVNGDRYTFRQRSPEGEYIDVNDKPADAWIDGNGKIGSNKSGGPTWFQWLKFYNLSPKQIKQFLLTKGKYLLPDKLDTELQADELLAELESQAVAKDFFTWGTPMLDEKLTPLSRGKMFLLVGETGTGKTEFSFQMATENALIGYNVLYLSLEMTNAQLVRRHALKRAGVSQKSFREGKYSFSELAGFIKALPKTLKFQDNSGAIDTKALEHLVITKKYDLLLVDNLGFVDGDGANSLDKERNISRALKQIKDKTGCTIGILHHFKKSDSSKQEQGIKIRSVDAILGNSKISHDVDFIIQVARDKSLPEDADPSQKAELLVVQQKDRDWGEYSAQTIYFQRGKFYDTFRGSNFDSKGSHYQSGVLHHFEKENLSPSKSEPSRGMSEGEVSLDEAFEDLI